MLYEKLKEYGNTDAYPFHMPGHKRQMTFDVDPYQIDITEIDGFDNLHSSEGILLSAQTAAAELYHVNKSYYLINGSTCGLLAAISASCKLGGDILIARNCHKAVYHGILLRQLKADYLCPKMTRYSILGQITPEMVEEAFARKRYEAVVITSPTYEGIVSDIEKIAQIVHAHGAVLIVDEAHGAHFGIGDAFPRSAATLGADLVVMSLHKTLPAFTQTALLHLCSDRVEERQVAKFLGIYETSSPSYVLMAGIDRCIGLMQEEGEKLLLNARRQLMDFYEKAKSLKRLHVLSPLELSKDEAYDFDISKLVIMTRGTTISGKELSKRLREHYHLELEMASMEYALAMTSLMDTKEGLARLIDALCEIDAQIDNAHSSDSSFELLYQKKEAKLTISEADETNKKELPFVEAKGQLSGAFVSLYPPGIPVLCPGEIITQDTILLLEKVRELGFELTGLMPGNRIEVCE